MKTAKHIIAKIIAQRNRELIDEKKKLDGNVDAKITEHLADAIKQLGSTGISIHWDGIIGDKQIESLTLQGDQMSFDVRRELGNANALITSIARVKNGLDGLIATAAMPETVARIDELSEQIKGYQQQLNKVLTLKSLYATIDALKTEVAKYISSNIELDYLIKKYPGYKEAQRRIAEEFSFFENRTEEQVMAIYSEHLFQAERKVADADEKIKALTEELKTTQSRSKQLSDDWEAKNKELLEIEKRPDYVEYCHRLQERNESQPSLTLWEQQLADNEKLIADFGGKIDAAGKEKVQMEEQGLALSQVASLTCIFMAKAVFAKTDDGKDLDCIFVDDPIQALDDINILSMIDLLRNVAFTLNKQIVITTHDKNFFQLLQKKMPQDRFNACYLRLKERGKFTVVES